MSEGVRNDTLSTNVGERLRNTCRVIYDTDTFQVNTRGLEEGLRRALASLNHRRTFVAQLQQRVVILEFNYS